MSTSTSLSKSSNNNNSSSGSDTEVISSSPSPPPQPPSKKSMGARTTTTAPESTKKVFKCFWDPRCRPLVFPNVDQRKAHEVKVHKAPYFQCDVCKPPKFFLTVSTFNSHRAGHDQVPLTAKAAEKFKVNTNVIVEQHSDSNRRRAPRVHKKPAYRMVSPSDSGSGGSESDSSGPRCSYSRKRKNPFILDEAEEEGAYQRRKQRRKHKKKEKKLLEKKKQQKVSRSTTAPATKDKQQQYEPEPVPQQQHNITHQQINTILSQINRVTANMEIMTEKFEQTVGQMGEVSQKFDRAADNISHSVRALSSIIETSTGLNRNLKRTSSSLERSLSGLSPQKKKRKTTEGEQSGGRVATSSPSRRHLAPTQQVEKSDDEDDDDNQEVPTDAGSTDENTAGNEVPHWVKEEKYVVVRTGVHRKIPPWDKSLFYALKYSLKNLLKNNNCETPTNVPEIRQLIFPSVHPDEKISKGSLKPQEALLERIQNQFQIYLEVWVINTKDSYTYPMEYALPEHRWRHILQTERIIHLLYLTKTGYYFPITDIEKFQGFTSCKYCDRMFPLDKTNTKIDHEKRCRGSEKVVRKAKTGYYRPPEDPLEFIENLGIELKRKCKLYKKDMVVWDTEAFLKNFESSNQFAEYAEGLVYFNEHELACISAVTNVKKNVRPRFFMNHEGDDKNHFKVRFIDWLLKYAEKSDCKYRKKKVVKKLLHELEKRIELARNSNYKGRERQLINARDKLLKYSSTLILLSYNGSNYDHVLSAKYGMFDLLNKKDGPLSAVRKNAGYSLVATRRLKFLDLLNYQGTKTSLRNYLRSFYSKLGLSDPEQHDKEKSYFPYRMLKPDYKLLNSTSLPRYEDFYNDLSKDNLLDDDYNTFQKHLKKGKTEEEALKIMGLTKIPLPGRELYKQLEIGWKQRGIRTFRDLLREYSLLDVEPLLKVAEFEMNKYHKMGVMAFHQYGSLPSLAFNYMIKQANVRIRLPDIELRTLLQDNIVGGPSIVSCRYVKVGESKIKHRKYEDDAKTVKSIIGFDCNSMYGDALSKEMFVGNYILRRKENNFKPEVLGNTHPSLVWIEWEKERLGKDFVQHMGNIGEKNIFVKLPSSSDDLVGLEYQKIESMNRFNSMGYYNSALKKFGGFGKTVEKAEYANKHLYQIDDKKIKRLEKKQEMSFGEMKLASKRCRLDGFIQADNDEGTPAVYLEYFECGFSHGFCETEFCTKKSTPKETNEFNTLLGKSYEQLKKDTMERLALLNRNENSCLIFMWSCVWEHWLKHWNEVKQFEVNFTIDNTPNISKQEYDNEQELVSDVQCGLINGIILADFAIPQGRRAEFEDFPPLFYQREIRKQDIKGVMKTYGEKYGILPSKQSLLVSGFSVKQVAYSINYVRYLMSRFGCRASNVQLVYQYKTKKVFGEYIRDRAEARKQADIEKNPLEADTQKALITNSFGYSITNELKFRKTIFCDKNKYDKKYLFQGVGEPCGADDEEDFWVVDFKPKTVYHRFPYTIGWQVLQLAKINLLEFAWDFLGYYLHDSSWQHILSDTDSHYIALSEKNLRDCVKPELLQEYDRNCYKFLVDDRTPESLRNTYRKPGLWKEEFRGTEIVALSSKSYYMWDEELEKSKFAQKGVQLKYNEELLKLKIFKDVLFDKYGDESESRDRELVVEMLPKCENRGFRKQHGRIFTYTLRKKGMHSLYLKKFVHDNYIDCSPLPDPD